jgi:hypothetical protein
VRLEHFPVVNSRLPGLSGVTKHPTSARVAAVPLWK